ncbi:MAG: hypothetical protein QNJ68_00625 [Microcoleaceae cyanobacterium MO_207.B10]|nr:hypothetical protein [Microcoleaceae cyanobacterium MO_207.B10]
MLIKTAFRKLYQLPGINPINYPLFFDCLRGKNEVTYAAKTFKKAKFVILDAPLLARLKRLLTRNDAFDKITKSAEDEIVVPQKNLSFSTLGIPEASSLFTSAEAQEIFTNIKTGIYQQTEVSQKLKILVEESINYDSETTKIALQAIAPQRTLLLDTTKFTPQQIAQKVIKYIRY